MKILDELLGLRPNHFFLGVQIVDEESDHWLFDGAVCLLVYFGVDYLIRIF